MAKPIMGTTAGATTRRIQFTLDNSNNTQYVDVAKLLSETNHRLYRQGRMYCVRVGFDGTNVGANGVAINALPNSWMFRKAWKLAKQAHDRAMRESTMPGQAARGRWKDFRIKYDKTQYDGNHGFIHATGITRGSAEYMVSQVAGDTGPAGGEGEGTPEVWQFHGLGVSTNSAVSQSNTGQLYTPTGSFGVLDTYSESEDTEQNTEPDDGSTSPYRLLEDDSDKSAANYELMAEDGDNPPYNPVDLQSLQQVYVTRAFGTTAVPQMTPWIYAPCGLLRLGSIDSSSGNSNLVLEVMEGNYKGVLSEAI